ncbi:MAG: ribonuclease P protein component [Dysgonamonadaceae bacterium]|jgi:ribonuclease P protein component|nr:ribonuclease P protein component [Dysgonamonadaceae bacterium]
MPVRQADNSRINKDVSFENQVEPVRDTHNSLINKNVSLGNEIVPVGRRHVFQKKEKISLKNEIELVFAKGESFLLYPLRVIYVQHPPTSGAQAAILISVPKKRLKKAVSRNRVKRFVREAYRLNKNELVKSLAETGKNLLAAFVFVGNSLPDYHEVEISLKNSLVELNKRL